VISGATLVRQAEPVEDKVNHMETAREVIQVAAGDISAELRRRGIGSDEQVTVTIEPERELIPGRRESRARVVAAGLTDDDIDRLIKQAQREVEPHLG
jgi:hypothetical protein